MKDKINIVWLKRDLRLSDHEPLHEAIKHNIKFKINEGSEVKAGQELVIIEAMKMENIIRTDYDVKIKKIEFSEGDAVGVGQVIMSFA